MSMNTFLYSESKNFGQPVMKLHFPVKMKFSEPLDKLVSPQAMYTFIVDEGLIMKLLDDYFEMDNTNIMFTSINGIQDLFGIITILFEWFSEH